MKPQIRTPEIYEGMTLEQILNERTRTLATLERLLGFVTKLETMAGIHTSITTIRKEIESVEQCIRLNQS